MSVSEELREAFEGKVALNYIERLAYSHDMGSMPDIVGRMMKSLPDAVVRAESVDDLRSALEIARKYHLPITPRAAGTSAYGGAIPLSSGLVVHVRMDRILEIDEENRTATVEPGAVWMELEKKLRERGLATRLYPSSALSSTVGGFVSMDGVGYGSLEFGTIRENVAEVELLTPDGKLRTLSDADLDLAVGAQGITGFLTKIKLHLRLAEEDASVAAVFTSTGEMLGALRAVSGLGIWNITAEGPACIRLKHRTESEHSRGVSRSKEEVEAKIPEGWVALLTYPAGRGLEAEIRKAVEAWRGKVLDERVAAKLFEERFYTLRFKKLGPSVLSSEAVIPLTAGHVLEEIEERFPEAAIEVTLARGRGGEVEMACLLNIPADERKGDYALGYLKMLEVIGMAKKGGGRAYSTGIYFSKEAESILGSERLRRLWEFKRSVDPLGIMNPGKVISPKLDKRHPAKALLMLMDVGRTFSSVAFLAKPFLWGKAMKRPLPEELVWDAYACAQCGHCAVVCPLYQAVGWETASPRGRFFILRKFAEGKIELDQRMQDIFFLCTTCRQCNITCQCNIQIEQDFTDRMRPLLLEQHYDFPPLYRVAYKGLKAEHNLVGLHHPNAERGAWMPSDIHPKEQADIAFWGGCLGSFIETNMPINSVRIISEAGDEFTYLGPDEWCCGLPYLVCGMEDDLKESVEHNIEEMKKRGVKTIVTSCSGCFMMWSQVYPKLVADFPFEVRHIVQYAADAIADGRLNPEESVDLTVTYHDPCHLARHGGEYEKPREILRAIPGVKLVEMEHNREECLCCGGVSAAFTFPEVSVRMWANKMAEVLATGAHVVTTACPCCEFNLRMGAKMGGHDLKVHDVTDLLVKSLGFEPKEVDETVYRVADMFIPIMEEAKERAMAVLNPVQ